MTEGDAGDEVVPHLEESIAPVEGLAAVEESDRRSDWVVDRGANITLPILQRLDMLLEVLMNLCKNGVSALSTDDTALRY